MAPTPFIRPDEGGDSHAEYHNSRDAGSQKGRFRRCKARLLEEEGCVLAVYISIHNARTHRRQTHIENAIDTAELLHAHHEDRQSGPHTHIPRK